MLHFLIILLIFKEKANCNTNVVGNFMECQSNSLHNQLLLEKTCYENEFETKTTVDIRGDYDVSVLYKRPYVFRDIGFECKIKKTTIIYHTDLTFNRYHEGPFVDYIQLSKEDCFKLTKEKLCNNIPMNCRSNKTCNYIEPRQNSYPVWIGKKTRIYYECQFNERLVTAEKKFDTKPVFHDAVGPCDINSGVCFLPSSTVVWNGHVTYCAYEKIANLNSTIKVKLDKNNFAILSSKDEYLFQLVDDVSECGIKMKSTTSGLFIAFEYENRNNENLISLRKSNMKIDSFHDRYAGHLLFAERDEKFLLFKKEINKIGCSLMLNSIQTQLHKQDTFKKINYLGNKTFLLSKLYFVNYKLKI